MNIETLARVGKAGSFYLLLVSVGGCATRGDVRQEVERLAAQQEQVDRLEERLVSINEALDRQESEIGARQGVVADTAARALLAGDQARRAEDQVGGELAAQTVFRLDGIDFEPGSATLTPASRTLLDQLADRLRVEDAGYYLELRAARGEGGGTLEMARAETVRRYLHDDHGLPLHAVSTLQGADHGPSAAADGGAAPTLEIEPIPDSLAVVVVRPFSRP